MTSFNEHNLKVCKQAVSVSGFGYTGSSYLINLLKEFKDVSVVCSSQEHNAPSQKLGGVTFYREMDLKGLREIFVHGDNSDFNAFMIVLSWRLTHLLRDRNHYVCDFQNTTLFKQYAHEFFMEILNLTPEDINFIKNTPGFYFQIHANMVGSLIRNAGDTEAVDNLVFPNMSYNTGYQIFYTRKAMSEDDFNQAVQRFLSKIISSFESNKLLVLDNLLALCSLKEHKNLLPSDLKQICVLRDIRDSYYEHLCFSTDPQDLSVSAFAKARNDLKIFDNYKDSERVLTVWLEDLVYHYDEVKAQILKFLNLDEKDHAEPFKYFDPGKLKNEIGRYKRFHDQSLMEKLSCLCPDLCYRGQFN